MCNTFYFLKREVLREDRSIYIDLQHGRKNFQRTIESLACQECETLSETHLVVSSHSHNSVAHLALPFEPRCKKHNGCTRAQRSNEDSPGGCKKEGDDDDVEDDRNPSWHCSHFRCFQTKSTFAVDTAQQEPTTSALRNLFFFFHCSSAGTSVASNL